MNLKYFDQLKESPKEQAKAYYTEMSAEATDMKRDSEPIFSINETCNAIPNHY